MLLEDFKSDIQYNPETVDADIERLRSETESSKVEMDKKIEEFKNGTVDFNSVNDLINNYFNKKTQLDYLMIVSRVKVNLPAEEVK
jgi:hypothetical protein